MKRNFYLLIALVSSAVLMQGFGCGSALIRQAQLDFQNGDVKKCITSVNKELAVNPNNPDAHLLLAEVYTVDKEKKNHDLANAMKELKLAEPYITDPKVKASFNTKKRSVVFASYSRGVEFLTGYYNSKKMNNIDSALKYFNLGAEASPLFIDFYPLLGQCYDIKGDAGNAVSSYKKYFEVGSPEFQLAEKYNMTLKMPQFKVVEKFGKPINSVAFVAANNIDSLKSEKYKVDGKELYAHFEKVKDVYQLIGWRYDQPSSMPEADRGQYTSLNPAVYIQLVSLAYKVKNYDEAIGYCKKLLNLDPTNTDGSTYIIELFQVSGKSAEAQQYVESMIAKDPTNKVYYAISGDMYVNQKNIDKAIEQYEKALKIDPVYDIVLRNLGSVLKNKAGDLQKAEKIKLDANPSYKVNNDAIFPILKKSAEFFLKASKTKTYEEDFEIYLELANIYFVLDDKAQLKSAIDELVKLEFVLEDNQVEKKKDYYLGMAKIYGYIKDNAKMEEATKKLEELK